MKNSIKNNDFKAVAHRGFAACYPENTIESLQAAIDIGADLVEIDIQFSKDGVPVMIHDDNLKRTTGIDRSIFTLLASEIPTSPGTEKLALLTDVIFWLKKHPQVKLFVELKQESIDMLGIETCVSAIKNACEDAISQCVFISFNEQSVSLAKRKGFLFIGWVLKSYNSQYQAIARDLSPDYLFCNYEKLPSDGSLVWEGSWKWVFYEVVDVKIAENLVKRGAHYIETKEVEKMLALLV